MSMFGVRDAMIAKGQIPAVGSSTTEGGSSPMPTDETAVTPTTTETAAAPSAGVQVSTGEANPQTATTEATVGAPADDYADMPFNKHPRFQQVLTRQKEADARAAKAEQDATEARASATELADRLAAIEASREPAKIDLGIPTFDPSTVVGADAVAKAEADHKQFVEGSAAGRAKFVADLEVKLAAGELEFTDAQALLAQADDNHNADLNSRTDKLENLKLKHQLSTREQAERLNNIDALIAPLFAADKYPNASPEVVKTGIASGLDPEAVAKWSHEQNTPLVSSAVTAAKAAAEAEYAAKFAEQEKELKRLQKLAGNLAAAPSTLKPGNGDSGAPSPPKNIIQSQFGMKQKILDKVGAAIGR